MAFVGNKMSAKNVNGGRFSDTGRAGDAEAYGAPRMRQQLLDEKVCGFAMVGALALDQRNRTSERRTVARANTASEVGRRKSARGHRFP